MPGTYYQFQFVDIIKITILLHVQGLLMVNRRKVALCYQFKKNVSQMIQLNALVIGKVKVKQCEKRSMLMGMH